MRTRTPWIRRSAATAAFALIAAGLLATTSSTATATPDLDSGPDWTITQVAGGYQVALTLDEPLPVVDDAATILVDGEDYGVATESADGLSLSVITSDAAVADADDVQVGWSSGATSHTEPTNSPVTAPAAKAIRPVSRTAARAALAGGDGSTPGSYSYTEDDYDFGDQAIATSGIGGVRSEMTGRIYLPTTGGARPTVVILHGRHTSCSNLVSPAPSNPNRWPCVAGQIEVPSYKGYDALGQLLATHGYAVVSISANSINANDNQLALDNGALARGRLTMDSLEMLKKANAGSPVSYFDAALNQTLTLDQALASTVPDSSGPIPTGTLTAADLVGRFDLSNVGLMGHSRGGEGVVSAVTLNQALANPFGINSVLPLAPVDFGRMTVADTDMLVILPYCDGDVSNQQGQHFSDDSRYAFDDNALRSTVWVMGADHNFFNTIWTPGLYPYSSSDDWSPTSTTAAVRNDTVCSTSVTGNQRLSAADQHQTGAVLMSDWFRLTLGDETDYLPMFDGTVKPTLDSVPAADVRAIATAPVANRADINRLTVDGPAVTTTGASSSGVVCASTTGRTVGQSLPYCAAASTIRSTSGMPHWTPASFAPNVPASPMMRYLWTSTSGTSAGSMIVRVPAPARNATSYQTLSFNMAPDESVVTGTDLTVTVVDGAGATWSTLASAVNPLAVTRMPISGNPTLNKIVLQQVSIPVSSITGVDLTDIREIRFSGAVGADGSTSPTTAPGGAYLTDLAWSSSAIGTPVVAGSMPTVGVVPTTIEEGDNSDLPRTVAVVLSKPVATTVSAYFSSIGSTSATTKVGPSMEKVTFAPGETCKPVSIPTLGDSVPGAAATTPYKIDVAVPAGVITGDNAFANVTVREDDGVTAPAVEVPPVGVQGDACAEYKAQTQTFALGSSQPQPHAGDDLVLTGSGYRPGESVALSLDGTQVLTAIAAGDGTVTFPTAAPSGLGQHRFVATGAGSLRTSQFEPYLRAPTSTSLAIAPATPVIKQSVTLTATVTGLASGAGVDFLDGTTSLGTAPVVNGVATLPVPAGFGVGAHSLSAVLSPTGETDGSSSGVIAFTLAKGQSTTLLELSAPTTTYGTGATGTVTVQGADGGTVTVTAAGGSYELPLDSAGTASFDLPVIIPVGSYDITATYSGTDSVDAGPPATATYTVTKAASATTAQSKSVVKKGKKLTVSVTVAGVPGVTGPSGPVTVSFSGVKKTVTLVDGTATTSFTATKLGVKTVKVTYAGNESYVGSSTSKTVTVKKK